MPAVVLGTDAFVALAAEAAAIQGLPHLPVVTVEHPIGGVDPATIRSRGRAAAERVARALTTDPQAPRSATGRAAEEVEAPDDLDVFQLFAMTARWGDGLPVLPPTRARVQRLVGGVALDPAAVIGRLAPTYAPATVEAIAANAVLAGATAEHLPVIVAAVRAVATPHFNLEAIQATTHPCGPLVVVNGPVAGRLAMNAGTGALGPGNRANAVIGRALRLVLQNVGGARPGDLDRATLGHPGKYTYCFAENEAASPWEPLSVERGLARDESGVTVCGSEAPHNVNDHASTTADGLLRTLAGTLATTGNNNVYLAGEPLVVLGPEHARTLAAGGLAKADVKRALWERARVAMEAFSAENLARFATIDPARFGRLAPGDRLAPALTADDMMIVVAGGPGKHSAIVPTFGTTRSVTVKVEE